MNLVDEVLSSLENWGKAPVMVERDISGNLQPVYAGQFIQKINSFTEFFKKVGLGPGILVPMLLDNSVDFPAVFFALLSVGAVPSLFKPTYMRMELDEIFKNANPSIIICEHYLLEKLEPWTTGRSIIVRHGEKISLLSHTVTTLHPTEFPKGTVSVNYTYRGIGYPLGAMIGENGYLDASKRYQSYVQFSPGDRVLALLPMNHIFTIISSVILPMIYGLTTYIVNSGHPRIITDVMQKEQINYLSSVPELLLLMARLMPEEVKMDSLQVLVSGGSPLSIENQKLISNRFQVEVLNGYGLTEIAPVTANRRNNAVLGSLGEFCLGLQGRIENSADSLYGEIQVIATDTFFGYLGRQNVTAMCMDGNWFRTGDLGKIEGEQVYFLGEQKRTLKVNGQLVDLNEVERAIRETGIIDHVEVSGTTNHISAKLRFSGLATGDEVNVIRKLKLLLRSIIAEYKIPRTIEII